MEPLSIETAEEIGDLYVDERSRSHPFVYLDVAKRRVYTALSEIGSAPESVWNGRAVRWAVAPEARADRLAAWLEKQRETLTQICDGIVIANGNGRRNDGVNDLIEAFGDALADWGTEEENLAPRWTAAEWLFGNGDSLERVWPEGETLAACVARHAASAAAEGFIVGDLEEAIRDRAKRYRSTPPRILEDLDLPAAEDDETWSDLACDGLEVEREVVEEDDAGGGIVTVNDGADIWHTTEEGRGPTRDPARGRRARGGELRGDVGPGRPARGPQGHRPASDAHDDGGLGGLPPRGA